MSYDFCIEVDTGGEETHFIEPYFADEHPELTTDGMAGTAVATATGYARCGNYTSNVSGMWTLCLTAAMQELPDAQQWAGDDDRRMLREYGPTVHDIDDRKEPRVIDTGRLCLRDLHGKPAAALVPVLAAAVRWGIDHLDELRERNPDNGWGNAEGAVTYLWDIQRMCEQHPKGKLAISS